MADGAVCTIRHLFIMFNNCKKDIKFIRYYVCTGIDTNLLYFVEYDIPR